MLIETKQLRKYFSIRKGLFGHKQGQVKAVDDITFAIDRSHTLGLVGESGCGKSTLGRTLLRLGEPTSGEIHFEGVDLRLLEGNELRRWRRNAQMVFQDPTSSLNPVHRVQTIVGEGLKIHQLCAPSEVKSRVETLLSKVGLNTDVMKKFPHELSGGQRQRVAIARALAVSPKFIVADEAIASLDVSIQAQILNLFLDLQDEFSISYLFISHDLRAVEFISQDIAVMVQGRWVESVPAKLLQKEAKHPYTKLLLESVSPEGKVSKFGLEPLTTEDGCVFANRCPIAENRCRKEVPLFREIDKNHGVACHLV